ncbi:hypothetical protein RIF29_43260 [Crotalaria pallida]|uniref:Uncharacterized protein n=1 Tax=Crotalaria pallida TaxID=3830 RepID=A0AAN9HMV6_CROPI
MNCWHQSYILSLWTEEKGKGAQRQEDCNVREARRTLPGLDMPRILLKERGAFGNADTGGAWLSSARAVSHTAVNSFPGLVHTARHTMGAGHARSRYLNRKEGDAEGRASDWSEVVTRSEQVDRSSFFTSPCPHTGATWGRKKRKRDDVSLAFGIAGPNGRPARRAISSVVERAPDNCVVVPGL